MRKNKGSHEKKKKKISDIFLKNNTTQVYVLILLFKIDINWNLIL